MGRRRRRRLCFWLFYIINIYGYSLYIPYIFHIYFLNMFHIFSLVCFLIYGVNRRQVLIASPIWIQLFYRGACIINVYTLDRLYEKPSTERVHFHHSASHTQPQKHSSKPRAHKLFAKLNYQGLQNAHSCWGARKAPGPGLHVIQKVSPVE